MKRVPWQIGLSQAAVEFAEIDRIAEYLRIYLANEVRTVTWQIADSRRKSHQERQDQFNQKLMGKKMTGLTEDTTARTYTANHFPASGHGSGCSQRHRGFFAQVLVRLHSPISC